ncbi:MULTISPECIES: TylF/MycF/NovP-related O-methyltransferase [unclassified Microcoleus]|uniref:TylF/MycF/NovP-related O-methyltransferase n=1 Tax=unclassified Microcoleus TaxID=2642155 RepID=UPI002FD305A9
MSETEEKFDGTKKYSKDKEIENKLAALFEKHKISPVEIINCFPIYARRTVIKKYLAHYELFRRTIDLPGDIVELGVFRGQSLMTFANFLEARNIGDRTKKVWGFDNFKGFTGLRPEDGPNYDQSQKVEGGFSPEQYYNELLDVLDIFDGDRFVGWKKRVELIVGNVTETIPEFVTKNPGLRISLLHFDIDLYEPTKIGLDYLYPLVVPGGVIIFDEYGILEWSGESKAVEEYFKNQKVELKKFEWNNVPGAYIIKQ